MELFQIVRDSFSLCCVLHVTNLEKFTLYYYRFKPCTIQAERETKKDSTETNGPENPPQRIQDQPPASSGPYENQSEMGYLSPVARSETVPSEYESYHVYEEPE